MGYTYLIGVGLAIFASLIVSGVRLVQLPTVVSFNLWVPFSPIVVSICRSYTILDRVIVYLVMFSHVKAFCLLAVENSSGFWGLLVSCLEVLPILLL